MYSNRLLHLIGGLLLGIVPNDFIMSVYCGAIAGGCLEFKDKAHGGKWDWIDFLFTIVGSVISGLIKLII